MKRAICLLLALLALAACAAKPPKESAAPAPSAQESAPPAPSASQPPAVSSEAPAAASEMPAASSEEPAGSSEAPASFDPQSLGEAAADYYERKSGWRPPEYEVADNGDGTYTIHLFETVDDGGGASHTATAAWYTVNAAGVGSDDVMGGEVDLFS